MTQDKHDRETGDRILEAHQGMQGMLDATRSMKSRWLAGSPESVNMLDDGRLLSALGEALREHFAFEETGGFLNSVLERMPHEAHHATRLLAQHRELEQRLVTIEHRLASTCSRFSSEMAELAQELGGLLQALRDHEAEENRLVQRAFYRDTGTGD